MHRIIYLLLIISFPVFADWTPLTTNINDDLNDIEVWYSSNKAIMVGNKGIYVSSNIGVSPFVRFQIGNADSLAYNRIQFKRMIKFGTSDAYIVGQDTVQNKSVIFKYDVDNATYSFIHTTATGYQLNGIGVYNNKIYAVGNSALIIEVDGSSTQYLTTNLNNRNIRDFSAKNSNFRIVGEGFYAEGYTNVSSLNLNIIDINDTLTCVEYSSTSSSNYSGGKNFYVGSAPSTHFYGSELGVTDMIRTNNSAYLSTQNGVYIANYYYPNMVIEHQVFSDTLPLNGITSGYGHLYACGPNGRLIKTTLFPEQATHPYLDLLENHRCTGENQSLDIIKGSSTSCKWYINDSLVSTSCNNLNINNLSDSVSVVRFVGSNAYYTDSVSEQYYVVDSAIYGSYQIIDSVLCRKDVVEIDLFDSETDMLYYLYDVENEVRISSPVLGNGNILNLSSDSITESGNYLLESIHFLGGCSSFHPDTLRIKVEKPKTQIHSQYTNTMELEDMKYYAQSNEATNFSWNFPLNSNISSSNLEVPTVHFNNMDSVTTELISWTDDFCYDTTYTNLPYLIPDSIGHDTCSHIVFNTISLPNYVTPPTIVDLNEGYGVVNRSYEKNLFSSYGSNKSKTGFRQLFTKYDDNDALKWQVSSQLKSEYHLTHSASFHCTEDDYGNIYLAIQPMQTQEQYFFDNSGDSILIQLKTTIIKLNPEGKMIDYIQCNKNISVMELAVDHNQQPFIVLDNQTNLGSFNFINSVNGVATDTIIYSNMATNFRTVAIKYNNDGSVKWHMPFRFSLGARAYFDSVNNLYLACNDMTSYLFNDGLGTQITLADDTISGNYGFNPMVLKFDTLGALKWDVRLTSNRSSQSVFLNDEVIAKNGDLYIVGSNTVTPYFPVPDTFVIVDATDSIHTYTRGKFFLIKLSRNGMLNWVNWHGYAHHDDYASLILDSVENTLLVSGVANDSYANNPIAPFEQTFTSTNSDSVSIVTHRGIQYIADYDSLGAIRNVYLSAKSSDNDFHSIDNYKIISKPNGFRQLQNHITYPFIDTIPFVFFGMTVENTSDSTENFYHFNLDCADKYCPNPITTVVHDTICANSSYTFINGVTIPVINQDTVYTCFIDNGNSCMDKVYTQIHTIPNFETDVYDTICFGEAYTFPDLNVENAIYADMVQTSHLPGEIYCDSIINTHIKIIWPIDVQNHSIINGLIEMTNVQSHYTYQWYICENGELDILIPNANNSFYQASNIGEYAVVIDNGLCSDTSICFNVDFVNTIDFDKFPVSIYPNPSLGIFNIQTSQSNYKLEVLTLNGELLKTHKVYVEKFKLDLTDYAAGIYFIRIDNLVHKLVIQ